MDSCLCGAFPVCWALTVTFTHSHSDGRPLTDWGENWCRGSLSGHSCVWSQDLRWRPQLAHQEQFLVEYLVRWYFNMQPGYPGIKSLIPISWRDAHSCSCVINTYWILSAWLLSPLRAGKWCFILFIFLLVAPVIAQIIRLISFLPADWQCWQLTAWLPVLYIKKWFSVYNLAACYKFKSRCCLYWFSD